MGIETHKIIGAIGEQVKAQSNVLVPLAQAAAARDDWDLGALGLHERSDNFREESTPISTSGYPVGLPAALKENNAEQVAHNAKGNAAKGDRLSRVDIVLKDRSL